MRAVGRRRVLVVAVLALAWSVVVSAPLAAKMPPFTVEIEPDPPVAGAITTVAIEMEMAFPVKELSGLLVLYRQDDLEERRDGIPIVLRRVDGRTRYADQVVIPEPGRWVLLAFPERSGWSSSEVPPGYPDTIQPEVLSPSASRPLAVPVLVAGSAVAAGLWSLIRRRSFRAL